MSRPSRDDRIRSHDPSYRPPRVRPSFPTFDSDSLRTFSVGVRTGISCLSTIGPSFFFPPRKIRFPRQKLDFWPGPSLHLLRPLKFIKSHRTVVPHRSLRGRLPHPHLRLHDFLFRVRWVVPPPLSCLIWPPKLLTTALLVSPSRTLLIDMVPVSSPLSLNLFFNVLQIFYLNCTSH